MPSDFSDAFELPFVRKAGGKDHTVPILTTRPLLAWCAEETARLRAEAKAQIPDRIKPAELLAANREAASLVCTMDRLRFLVRQPEGTVHVLELAAAAAGVAEGDVAAFVDAGTARENERDAARASGLFTGPQLLRLFPEALPTWVDLLLDAAESASRAAHAARRSDAGPAARAAATAATEHLARVARDAVEAEMKVDLPAEDDEDPKAATA